jgi:hypothetical protein
MAFNIELATCWQYWDTTSTSSSTHTTWDRNFLIIAHIFVSVMPDIRKNLEKSYLAFLWELPCFKVWIKKLSLTKLLILVETTSL